MRKYFCDRCEREVLDTEQDELWYLTLDTYISEDPLVTFHLCQECKKEVFSFIRLEKEASQS